MVNRYVARVLACWRCALIDSRRIRAFSVLVRSPWYRHIALLECNATLDTLRLSSRFPTAIILPSTPSADPLSMPNASIYCPRMIFGFTSPRDVFISYPIGVLCVFVSVWLVLTILVAFSTVFKSFQCCARPCVWLAHPQCSLGHPSRGDLYRNGAHEICRQFCPVAT